MSSADWLDGLSGTPVESLAFATSSSHRLLLQGLLRDTSQASAVHPPVGVLRLGPITTTVDAYGVCQGIVSGCGSFALPPSSPLLLLFAEYVALLLVLHTTCGGKSLHSSGPCHGSADLQDRAGEPAWEISHWSCNLTAVVSPLFAAFPFTLGMYTHICIYIYTLYPMVC